MITTLWAALGLRGMTILGTQARGSGAEGQGEHMGAFAVHFPPPLLPFGYFLYARCCVEDWEGNTLRCLFLRFAWYGTAGHCGRGTLPQYVKALLPRYAGRHTRYEYFPALRFSFSYRDHGPRLRTCARVQ
jgi:hypothetical protein